MRRLGLIVLACGLLACGSPVQSPKDVSAPEKARIISPLRLHRPIPSRATRATRRGDLTLTRASWYGVRPQGCYDHKRVQGYNRYTPMPRGLELYTAHRTLPCGTVLEVIGPAGHVRVTVADRGPLSKERDLDLSLAAFRAVCGPLSIGVCSVMYRRT